MDYRSDAPKILRDFLIYHETIKGHSQGTVDEYFLDLRTFFRFLKLRRGLAPQGANLEEVGIEDVDLAFVRAVTLSEVYEYLAFLSRDRVKNARSRDAAHGISASPVREKSRPSRAFTNI